MRKWEFGKAEDFPRCDSALSQEGNQSKNYEKINLHFSQCRASRSVRAKRNRCRPELVAGAGEEGRKEYNDRESAGNDGEDEGDQHDDQYKHDDGCEPDPVVQERF